MSETPIEIGRTFRNEGLDSTHAAEFSMLEAYEAYGDINTMKDLVRALVLNAARAVGRTVVPARDGSEIDLEQEWRSASVLDLVSEKLGEQIDASTWFASMSARRSDWIQQPGRISS